MKGSSISFTTRHAGRALLVALAFSTTACASWSAKQKGALAGAAGGAAVGGVVGNNTGSTARGAIIGAIVGGTAGAVIGHQMDQQAKELKLDIPGATVERVGEGIQVTFASGLLYDFDSDDIRADAATNLRQLAASLARYPNTELLIVGHTDSQGSESYNQDLSARRASAAAAYLSAQGIRLDRMRTSGRGESEALGTNETEAGRQINRRIEVAIFAGQAARAGAK
ncbi:MAG TPA: OmpA family protein [Gemmatimonadaceae bacterium]|nr:OmpA family protein [Gemmatimonadaceae bacterium]